MPGPIAILSALDTELESLVETLTGTETRSLGGRRVSKGTVGDREVVLSRAGIGKVNAAVLVALLWAEYRPRLIVFTGVAGGIDPELGIGDVVVAKTSIQHDAGVLEPDGLHRYQAGHVPFFNPTDDFGFSPSPELMTRVSGVLDEISLNPVMGRPPRVVLGTILTGDQYLHSEEARQRYFRELGGAAIDMEGAAIAQAAQSLGMDHLVIRSLSDLAGSESITDFRRFLDEVATNSARVVRHLLAVL